jgi:hypothetical protein
MTDEKLPYRAVRTTFWVAAWFALIFGLRGQADISVGLAIGALLGMFSLWSLAWAVPRLVSPERAGAKFWLAALLLLKLPLYAIVLHLAITIAVHPLALFAGIGLTPLVICLKVVSGQMFQKSNTPVGG